MSLAYKQFKVYFRLTLVITIAVAFAFVLFKNRNNYVKFWFFGLTDANKQFNVVWLVLGTAMAARIIWWGISFTIGLRRDLKELHREQQRQQLELANAARARELDDRERRLQQMQASSPGISKDDVGSG